MNRPVAGEFAHLIVRLLVVLCHICSYHQLLPLVLDWDVGSSCVDCCCLAYFTYAGGKCDLDVPFCGMCNTQLRVDLSLCLPRIRVACILLWVHTLLVA